MGQKDRLAQDSMLKPLSNALRQGPPVYEKRAGIPRRVYPHMFRATFATRLNLPQVNRTVIQELMGHANIQTTARYVGIAGKEMRAAIERLESAN